MKILIVSDSFKGSLSSENAGNAVKSGFERVFPNAEYKVIPVADGGEGSINAILKVSPGYFVTETVTGPLGEKLSASYAMLDDKTAVIEMAASAGMSLLKEDMLDPVHTTTYGVGELILSALNNGAEKIIMCIGDSATNDGGAGMAQALGAKLFDDVGNELGFGGGELQKLCRIDASALDDRICKIKITVACDVQNPLCGENGASKVFAPQKGATFEMVELLESALLNYAALIDKHSGFEVSSLSGAGAAGGLGAGLVAFCGAELKSGIEEIISIMNLEDEIASSDIIITGEGRVDATSASGKLVNGIGKYAKKYNKPLLVFSGCIGEGYERVYDIGVSSVIPIMSEAMTYEYAVKNASSLLSNCAEETARSMKLKF